MNKFFLIAGLFFAPNLLLGQVETQYNDSLQTDTLKKEKYLPEFVVKATRVGKNSPVAHEDISFKKIAKINHGVDLPILLDQAISVVTTSDAGAGVGYTGIRVRGSDATRVNVTINGIPLNDAESQGSYWVNLPDLSSSTSDIQIQRGVGSSTSGAGAFGASINVNTLSGTGTGAKPYGELSNSFGSFNTMKNTVKFGTGLIQGKWNFDGRLSQLYSDGYIDRSSSDLKSYYVSGGYLGEKTMVKAVVFSGHEKTYQAWYGVPVRYLDSAQAPELRKHNPYNYENEVDNYQQTHYHLHYGHKFSSALKFNLSLHYTRGAGYYEQYKGIEQNAVINYFSKENLIDYGLDTVFTAAGDTITTTDLIRRKWLDNHFYGTVFSLNYIKEKLNLTLGGGANQYLGKHYGEVIWSEFASNGNIRHRYYEDDAVKNDLNVYLKADYKLSSKIGLYLDLQERMIQYDFSGYDDSLKPAEQSVSQVFFNPKAGINYAVNENQAVNVFFGVGNKEPNRDDYVNSTPTSRPLSESMTDIELGYKLQGKKLFVNTNLYSMDYSNQLILTGAINDVGSAVRTNVAKSYRRGLEAAFGVQIFKNLSWTANATFSQNKIVEFTEFIDDWDTWGQVETKYNNTDIAFSPNVIAGSQFSYQPISSEKYGTLEVGIISKYVGSQYIDNTSNNDRKLEAYFVNDFRIQYTIKNKLFSEIVWSTWVRNFLNEQYVSNAWVYKYKSEGYDPIADDDFSNRESVAGRFNQIGAFPQAGINFFTGLTLKF